jgi:hypothetical protein
MYTVHGENWESSHCNYAKQERKQKCGIPISACPRIKYVNLADMWCPRLNTHLKSPWLGKIFYTSLL